MQDCQELAVWSKSRGLLAALFKITEVPPDSKCEHLVDMLRKDCIAIPANIARSFGCGSEGEQHRLMHNSLMSAEKFEHDLESAHDKHYLKNKDFDLLFRETGNIKKMLITLINDSRQSHRKN